MTSSLSHILNTFIVFGLVVTSSNAFQQHAYVRSTRNVALPLLQSSTRLQSTAPTLTPIQQQRRSTLLSRNGPYFKLERYGGKVEFGSTANLVTKLTHEPSQEMIAGWLSDERRVALSIWDPKLITDMGKSVYQLRVMTLQFITIQLQPTVELKMWTDSHNGLPVFSLQSIAFDPNLQILPGISVNADSLGIVIEVAGDLRPTEDGKGVMGKISFQTAGELPPPMRLLPEPAFKAASDSICDTITKFAVESFQRGAIAKYKEYVATQQ